MRAQLHMKRPELFTMRAACAALCPKSDAMHGTVHLHLPTSTTPKGSGAAYPYRLFSTGCSGSKHASSDDMHHAFPFPPPPPPPPTMVMQRLPAACIHSTAPAPILRILLHAQADCSGQKQPRSTHQTVNQTTPEHANQSEACTLRRKSVRFPGYESSALATRKSGDQAIRHWQRRTCTLFGRRPHRHLRSRCPPQRRCPRRVACCCTSPSPCARARPETC